MDIPLSIHLFIHFLLAILCGYLAGRYFKSLMLGIITGFIGGFLIDLDHILEYVLVYGPHFNIRYFLQGRQFLTTGQIHLWFHAWEFVLVFIILSFILKKNKIVQSIILTTALAVCVHLLTDTLINRVPLKFYVLSYRASQNFSAEKLMSPMAYEENMKLKEALGL